MDVPGKHWHAGSSLVHLSCVSGKTVGSEHRSAHLVFVYGKTAGGDQQLPCLRSLSGRLVGVE